MINLGERFKNGWNAFMGRDPTEKYDIYGGSSSRPDRTRYMYSGSKSIVSSIYNKIAVDVAQININHVRLNEKGQYEETINSNLNAALNISANLDQSGKELIQDVVMSMFDEGCVAIVPTDTDEDPRKTDSYEIGSLRVGKILEWYPDRVRLSVYREKTGLREEIILPKRILAIIENPFYAIMNAPNSTLQRLVRVLNQLDRSNEDGSSDKFNLIVQLPYSVKSPAKKQMADERRKDIEAQLTMNKYGIAYIDATEKVTQLNRSIENNLWSQATELETKLYNQMGLTQKIFDGTANEKELLDYYNRTIDPIISAIATSMERKWITKTARTQGQAIRYFRDPFKLVPVNDIAEIADKFTRNEIMTSNEIRSVIGLKPSKNPKADELRNSNINHPDESEVNKNDQ